MAPIFFRRPILHHYTDLTRLGPSGGAVFNRQSGDGQSDKAGKHHDMLNALVNVKPLKSFFLSFVSHGTHLRLSMALFTSWRYAGGGIVRAQCE